MKKGIDFDLIGRLAKAAEVENPYQRFSLTRNPFPKSAIADPHSMPFFSRSRKEALERIREFILYSYRSKRWSGLVLSGEYGSGKSHTLFYIYDQVNRQLGNLERDQAIAIYIEHPGDTINDLYGEFMEKIGRERFVDYVAKTLQKPALEILKQFAYQKFIDLEEGAGDALGKLKQLGKRIIPSKKNIAWDALSKNLISNNIILHRDLAKCLVVIVTENNPILVNSAWNFVIGKKLGKHETETLGLLSQEVSEDEIIKYIFPSVINILDSNGVSIIFLLLDELEKIASKSKQTAFTFLENMRSLIDNNLSHFSMVMGCVSESWEIIRNLSPGLADRIGEVIELRPLSDSEVRLLIEDYLSLARTRDFEGEPYAPFCMDSLREVNLISKGSVRYVLENCHMILERASIDPDVNRMIDLEYVRAILRR